MKTFRIAYTICEGDHTLPDEIIVKSERLTRRQAAARVWQHFTYHPNSRAEKRGFVHEILTYGFCLIADDYRGIKDLFVKEIEPVLVEVRGGVVQQVSGIPRDMTVVVRDYDSDSPEADGLGYRDAVWEG